MGGGGAAKVKNKCKNFSFFKKFLQGGKSSPPFKTPLSSSKEKSLQQHQGVIKYILSPQFSLVNSLCLLNVC